MHGSTSTPGNGTNELWYTVPYHSQRNNTRNISMVWINAYTRKKKSKGRVNVELRSRPPSPTPAARAASCGRSCEKSRHFFSTRFPSEVPQVERQKNILGTINIIFINNGKYFIECGRWSRRYDASLGSCISMLSLGIRIQSTRNLCTNDDDS